MRAFLIFVGALCALAAIGFTVYGIGFMFDDSYANRVVGGDAYNFIIYATRGTAYVCAGIVFAVLSVFCAVLAKDSAREQATAPGAVSVERTAEA